MNKLNFFIVQLMLMSVTVNATMYEDGQKNTDKKKWTLFDNTPKGASLSIVNDKHNSYIKLSLSGVENGYMLGDFDKNNEKAWHNKDENIIKWKMNYSENFIIYVSVETLKGHRYIYYTNQDTNIGKKGKFIHYGLGTGIKDGTWKTVERDLNKDLKKYEGNNTIEEVNAFMLRGSGNIDDIELIK